MTKGDFLAKVLGGVGTLSQKSSDPPEAEKHVFSH
jgi:hypothetical protein